MVKRGAIILLALVALAAAPASGSAVPSPGRIRPVPPSGACLHGHLASCRPGAKPKSGARHPKPPLVELGDIPGCRDGANPVAYLRTYRAPLLRVIINPDNYALGGIACARAAVSAGYRLHLVIQWWNEWKLAQIESFFHLVLGQLGKASWAISIGNEQELNSPHGHLISGHQYSDLWKKLEPIVAAAAPKAIRVAGEISPWGFPFLKGAQAFGLPGAQAVAAHPYSMHSCFSLSAFRTWAHEIRLPYWYDEGYRLPGVWLPEKSRTASEVQGAAVVGAWLGEDSPAPVGGTI